MVERNSGQPVSVPVPGELGVGPPAPPPPAQPPPSGSASRRRRSDAERNRAHVLQVARQLMQDRGIAGVTMDALAETAAVGKGTLYRGFGSRAGLAEALLDEAERDLQERILTGPPPLGPARRTVPASAAPGLAPEGGGTAPGSRPVPATEKAAAPAAEGAAVAAPEGGGAAPGSRAVPATEKAAVPASLAAPESRSVPATVPASLGAPRPGPAGRLRAFAEAYLELLRTDAALVLETERGEQGARFHTGAYAFWHAHVAGLLRAAGAPDPPVRAHLLLAMLAADLYLHLRDSGIDHDRLLAAVTDLVGRP